MAWKQWGMSLKCYAKVVCVQKSFVLHRNEVGFLCPIRSKVRRAPHPCYNESQFMCMRDNVTKYTQHELLDDEISQISRLSVLRMSIVTY